MTGAETPAPTAQPQPGDQDGTPDGQQRPKSSKLYSFGGLALLAFLMFSGGWNCDDGGGRGAPPPATTRRRRRRCCRLAGGCPRAGRRTFPLETDRSRVHPREETAV